MKITKRVIRHIKSNIVPNLLIFTYNIIIHFANCRISEMLELNNRELVAICTRIPDSQYIIIDELFFGKYVQH